MKKALIIMVVVLIPAITLAENPDSRPSITLGFSGALASLERETGGKNQDGEGEDIRFGASIKWPISENATINFGLGLNAGNNDWKENIFYYRSMSEYRSFNFGFNVTFYIGKSINI